ncbi:MAG: hypothetical protein QJR03_14570 [Sphaerobacter sp.]|nr:hypothetical protein [Sphaerobacter sp.]
MSKSAAASRRRVTLLLAVGAVLVFAVGVAWMSLGHANDPAYQQRMSMPGMSGEEEYLVNLWTDPYPLEPGRARVTVQVTSIIGSPVTLDAARLTPIRPDGTALATVPAAPLPDGNEPRAAMTAVAEFDQPGTWTLVATLTAGNGIEREVRFALPVSG